MDKEMESIFDKAEELAKDLSCQIYISELSEDKNKQLVESFTSYFKCCLEGYLILLTDIDKQRITYSAELADIMREKWGLKKGTD